MENKDLVSVVIPAYNCSSYLAEAVQSALQQTVAHIEVIVVNDGSTDSTATVAEEIANNDARVRVLHQNNGGISSARNAGIRASNGAYICFLDADDIYLPDKIERQLRFLDLFPRCDLVYSDYYTGDENLTPVYLNVMAPPQNIAFDELLVYRNWFAPMCPLFRKILVERIGLFDESLSACEDYDYWLRAAAVANCCYLPGSAGVYRTHPGQLHHDRTKMWGNYNKLIEKHFSAIPHKFRTARAAMYWWNARYCWQMSSYLSTIFWITKSLVTARNGKISRNILQLVR